MRQVWILALALVVAVPVGGLATYSHLLSPTGESHEKELVVIRPGMGVAAIARVLESEHLVRSAAAFDLYVRLHGQERVIRAGAYSLAPDMGTRGIAEALLDGKGQTNRLTVPEGFSLHQIAQTLDAHHPGSGERFLTLAGDAHAFADEFEWLKALPPGASLEGYLFPDTYTLAEGPGAERELIHSMLARFAEVVLPAYQSHPGHPLGLTQTITMASIVEKEAKVPTERPTIAGVFFNRLATHMPFGSDPTVEYALHRHQGENGLSLRDVAVDSPYNTYKHPGLPPGPIANPGLASIEAVLSPEKTPYMFFVARGDGSHAFTRTYQEHLATQRAIWAARKKG